MTNSLRVGFVPMSATLRHPFDLRNFLYYARKRHISFEIADPAQTYDIVVLAPRADLSVWNRYEKKSGKMIYLTVDSYLAIPKSDLKAKLRGMAKYFGKECRYPVLDYQKAMQEMCRKADAVVCTTDEQREDIQKYCANVQKILEFHFKLVRNVKTDYASRKLINLVWEGGADNLSGFREIRDVLLQLNKKHPLALHLLTDLEHKKFMNKFCKVSVAEAVGRIFGPAFRPHTGSGFESLVYLYQWNMEMLSRIVTGCDIAVIPIDIKNPLTSGKPENKLLLFWRMGMPAVVSATPAYKRAMETAGLKDYCRTPQQWYEKLEKMITDVKARQMAGELGKKTADTIYSEETYLRQWDELFRSVLQ